jgi:hypothetical protein
VGRGIPNLNEYYIYHYTFDLDMKAGWGANAFFWSKRRFMSGYPPRLTAPPLAAQRSTKTFVQMMNEGIDASQPWQPMRRRS